MYLFQNKKEEEQQQNSAANNQQNQPKEQDKNKSGSSASKPQISEENAHNVQIEVKVKRNGYMDMTKRFNVGQAIDQQEISINEALVICFNKYHEVGKRKKS